MSIKDIQDRTKQFAIDIAKFCMPLRKYPELWAYIDQLIRASGSVGANYRAVSRAKSNRDFINKLKIVEEECDESLFWLEVIEAVRPELKDEIAVLHREGDEILRIVVTSITTTRSRSSRHS